MPPTALIQSLEGVRRRVRVFSVLFGVGIAVCAAMALLLSTVLLDYLLNLPAAPRIVVILASLIGIGYVMTHWVVRPMLTNLKLSDVAGKLEHAFPAFDDRLRSTVDFVTKGTPGSDVMKDRVISEATELSRRFDLNKAVRTKPLWYSAGAAAGSVLVILLLGALVGHDYLVPALSRLLTPFGSHPWPKRVEIQMVSELPQRIPVGQRVDVRIRLSKGDKASREARVIYQYGDGREEKEIMTRNPDGVYSASLDARASAAGGNGIMKVWIEAGDDTTNKSTITVVQRLAITHVELIVTPPPYVGEPAATADLSAGPATVTFGSTAQLRVTFNKEIDPRTPITLSPGAKQTKPLEMAWDVPAGSIVTGHWVARESTTFQIHATDTDGFSNSDLTDYQVIVRQDQTPSVQITNPVHNEECTPEAVLPLRGIAEDDYGIASMKLIIVKLGDKPVEFPAIDLVKDGQPVQGISWARLDSSGERRRWQMDYGFDLSKISPTPLKPGDVIEYHLQVRDNFAFEGQYHEPVDSGKLRITILSQEQFNTMIGDIFNQIHDQIVEVRNTQRSLKTQTGDLRNDTKNQPQFSKADRDSAQQLIAKQATAAAQARQIASKLDDIRQRMEENKSNAQDLKDIAASVKDDLNQVSEHPMKDAAGQIDAAKDQKADPKADANQQQKNTDQRNKSLDQAQDKQQQAADKLDQAASRMGEVGGLSKAIENLKEIQKQQKELKDKSDKIGLNNLGKRPDQMSAEDKAAQKQNAEQQDKLGDHTQKAIEQMMAQAQKMQKSDPSGSKAMQKAAQTGQQQSVPGQMHQSADQQRQNQQAQAQQAQAQVDIGLQMMLNQLEEAQRIKLAELQKQLAEMQDLIKTLIKEQAGHNYDNLALQGGDVLKKMDAAMIDHLLAEADRSKTQLPPTPDLGTQTRLQEQTERNTRNIAHTAEKLPDGANIVAQLNRAADRMGRAITSLRDDSTGTEAQRLATAYDPPQVDALAALENAKKAVDEQADKANQAADQQKKEAIRAAYEKILQEQIKIDAQTRDIDKSPRLPDGALGNIEGKHLNQVIDTQEKLAERTTKLDDDLTAVGSIVYVWANKDIVDSMKGVKLELAKPQTGVTTQAEQTRIEEQIKAMIDSLKTEPKKPSDFHQARNPSSGGGGGSPPPPQLPTEAELRLLKNLQQAINKATETIAAQPNPDKPKIMALGGRQGQLRNLLGQLLDKASHGQVKLGPEPDAGDKLPEEASADKIDDQELEHALLNDDGQPDGNQLKNDAGLIGQRMGRSRQRLANDSDPGKTTQEIQKRIVQNMDVLIEAARAQQQSSSSQASAGKQPGDPQPGDPSGGKQPGNSQGKPGQGKPGGSTPAVSSAGNRDTDATGTPDTNIVEVAKEWGRISPRKREAVMEGASEKTIEKYKNFVDEYYRALGTKATE